MKTCEIAQFGKFYSVRFSKVNTMSTRLSASQKNTVLDDLSALIGLRATVLLAAWWGGRNIVIPAARVDTSVIAKVIGIEATRRLSEAYGAEQIFIPSLNWFEEVRRAKQVHALRARGIPDAEIAQIMVMTRREVADMAEVGRFAAEAVALEKSDRRGCLSLLELEAPQVRGGRGGPRGGQRKK